ncbi:MAG: Ig-like domain-containing protein [Bacteroidales bacterium]|nr:Ig-like domain-containing protein [Bacteroidales bacterium]
MTKRKIFSLIPLLAAIAGVLIPMMLPSSCANTTTPPTGGPKDTIPPVLKGINPLPGAVNVPVHKTKLEFKFNEYVVVKDMNSIYLSPPLEKAPKYRMKGKTLVVYFESDLEPNTTYTLDLTGAVADNNEGNMFPGYTLVFSTGPQIDSMMMTGIVQDCNTLKPVKGATVMLYKDQADSAIFLQRPVASSKTDDWGFFCIRNIQDTLYRVYAIKDENNNNKYDPDNERVAFLDSLFQPRVQVNDSLPELAKYDMKDTALCLARKQEVELNLFREKPSKQMIVKKERVGDRTAYVTFMAPGAHIYKMRIKGLPREKLITQFNIEKDSLEIWVNDQRKMPDTLKFQLRYDKTDTLGNLRPTTETVNLALDKKARAAAAAAKSSRRDIKHEDTIAVYTAKVEAETVEQYGFTIEFKYPLIRDAWDSLIFRSVNPRQQEKIGKYTVTRDSTNLRRYTIMPKEELMVGYEYFLKIPHRKFRDVNGYFNDSTEVKVTLPTDEKLSTVELNMTGVGGKRYIVDLLTEKRDRVIRSFIVDYDQKLVFPYVKAGKYCLRMTEDLNRNGIVDTGSLLEHRQPEKVKFYKLKDDSFLIDIPERTELQQDINMEEMFR